MWSYLATSPFIRPLPTYVESKVPLPKVLRLDEVVLLLVRLDHMPALKDVENLSLT